MKEVEQIEKLFHEQCRAGRHLLSEGKITWQEFEETMQGFEAVLRSMGADF